MKQTCFVLLFAIAAVGAASATRSSGQPSTMPLGHALDDGRGWLASWSTITEASPVLLRGAAASAFNEGATAERLLRAVIRSQPRSDAASDAHELLSRIYLRSGQYKRLIENFDDWARTFPGRDEVLTEKADVELFRGLPDQINGPGRPSTVPHEGGDDFSVPLSINGKPARFLVDTGGWMSGMSEGEAARLGLSIRQGKGVMGDGSGRGVTIRTAVARELTLGSMRFRNVSFAIIPGEERWGIVGVPLLLALERLHWSANGSFELGRSSGRSQGDSPNVVFFENHLLLAATVAGSRIFLTLDTGAETTELNRNFAGQFAQLVKGDARTGTRDLTGVGGTVSPRSEVLRRCKRERLFRPPSSG